MSDVHYPETNRTCVAEPPRHRHRRRRLSRHRSSPLKSDELLHTPLSNDSSRPFYWRDLDSLRYRESGSSSEPYGVRSVQRTQWPEEGGQRRGTVAVDRRKSTCLLYLQADHLFYRRLGGEEACIDAMTRHVQRVNSIYRNTGESNVHHRYCITNAKLHIVGTWTKEQSTKNSVLALA